MQYMAHICHIMQFSQIILVFFCIVGMVLKCEWRIALAFWTANCFSLLSNEGKQSSYIYIPSIHPCQELRLANYYEIGMCLSCDILCFVGFEIRGIMRMKETVLI